MDEIDTHTLTQTQTQLVMRRKYRFGGDGGGGWIEILSVKNRHFPFEFSSRCEVEDKKSIPLAGTRWWLVILLIHFFIRCIYHFFCALFVLINVLLNDLQVNAGFGFCV